MTSKSTATKRAGEVRVAWYEGRDALPDDVFESLLHRLTHGTLTTDHPSSSRGLPVVVQDDGSALGAGEVGEIMVDDHSSVAGLSAEQAAVVAAGKLAGYRIR